jgi:chromate transporter
MANPSMLKIFFCFLKIGCVSFGGFMSLVSMIETQVVEKRKWLDAEDMLDGVALATLLPGPMAVNTVAYVGYRLRGGLGALVSSVAVLLPTVVFMLVLSDLYFRFGTLPQVERIFSGILPAVAAIVLSVCLKMAGKNLKNAVHWGAFALVVLLFFVLPQACKVFATFGIVALYGAVGVAVHLYGSRKVLGEAVPPPGGFESNKAIVKTSVVRWLGFGFLGVILLLGVVPFSFAEDGYFALMRTFSSMSLTLFGGGYVFIPMIQNVVVDQYGWLSAKEFIDGIALGQVTPGPILISASFIGQKVAGVPGALLSTVAIFAPPAVLMVLLSGMLEAIKSSWIVQSAMKGIRIAVIGLIFRAFLNILSMAWPESMDMWGRTILVTGVFSLSFIALYRFKVDVVWVIPVAGIVGFLFG